MLKKNVLRRKSDFSSIYSKGKSVGDRYIVIFFKKNNLPYNRTAFLASKKVGNRARRLMKESLRTSDLELSTGFDIIFIARNTISGRKCAEVRKSLESALKKTKVLLKQ